MAVISNQNIGLICLVLVFISTTCFTVSANQDKDDKQSKYETKTPLPEPKKPDGEEVMPPSSGAGPLPPTGAPTKGKESDDNKEADADHKDDGKGGGKGDGKGKGHGGHTHKWDYVGSNGLHSWHMVDGRCGNNTRRQSPIDIDMAATKFLDTLDQVTLHDAHDKNGTVTAWNNGHSVNLHFDNAIRVQGGDLGASYKVAGVHFHWGNTDDTGSEHKINGNQFPLEMHIVTYNEEDYDLVRDAVEGDDSLAVLGVVFTLSEKENSLLNPIITALKSVKTPHERVPVDPFDLAGLLPKQNGQYFRYAGSLTTPPCAESVIWTLFRYPSFVSQSQLSEFRKLTKDVDNDGDNVMDNLDYNWRPVQPIYTRTVYRSFPLPSEKDQLKHEQNALKIDGINKKEKDMVHDGKSAGVSEVKDGSASGGKNYQGDRKSVV